jgi:hypothetical protein
VLAATVIWTAITLAPAPKLEPAPESTLDHRRGWLQLAPIGFGAPGPGLTQDLQAFDRAVVLSYRWGLSVGLAFEPVEHLLLGAAAGLDQSIWIFDNDDRSYELCFRGDCYGWNERGFGHLVRLGAELRVGWTSRWVMAWALFAAHVDLARMRLDCDNSVERHCSRSETDLGPGLGAGLGVALRPIPSFAVGLESSIDHGWIDRREDPFRAARTWDLSLVAIVRF